MATPPVDYMGAATKLASKLNAEDAAQVYAVLALAEAIYNLADELRGMGTEAQPIHMREA